MKHDSLTSNTVGGVQQQVGRRMRLLITGSRANDENTSTLKAKDFQDFMPTEASQGFERLRDGIRWKISVFIRVDWVWRFTWLPFLKQPDCAQDRERVFYANMPQIKSWLMSLDVTDCLLYNSLVAILPCIADVDPAFAKLALDPETWCMVVRADQKLSDKERSASLERVNHEVFRYVVNNALLHVFAALGNNHFLLIRDYLDHPCLYGSYTGLMPHYLFALLFQKVSVLRQISAEAYKRAESFDRGTSLPSHQQEGASR